MNEFMKLAIKEAKKAAEGGDVPVGAVIVKDGRVIATAHNMREKLGSATAHAEIAAIEEACKVLGTRELKGCSIYITLEPCPMCAGAILMSGITYVYFGAYEEKYGAAGSVFNLYYDYTFPKTVKFRGGIMEMECAAIMNEFFKELRSK